MSDLLETYDQMAVIRRAEKLLDAPIRRVAAENVPLPFADALEDRVLPTVDKVVETVRKLAAY
jgi:acetoin:2,6-dichlorophenolindophenol oxidoreductase subunit beta